MKPRHLLFALAAVAAQGTVTACSLTPGARSALAAAEPALLSLDTWACQEAALVPVVGAALAAMACPGEEAAVKAAIDSALSSDAGVPSGTQRVVTRAVAPGRAVCVGRLLVGPTTLPGSVLPRVDAGEGGAR